MLIDRFKTSDTFLQTFDISDEWTRQGYDEEMLRKLFKGNEWNSLKTRKFKVFDDDEGHNHWHVIL
jgi:hypothetical protein